MCHTSVVAVFEYYKHAAHLGKAKAQYNLGIMYYNGQGDLRKTWQRQESGLPKLNKAH
jgi:TPR repeat protein